MKTKRYSLSGLFKWIIIFQLILVAVYIISTNHGISKALLSRLKSEAKRSNDFQVPKNNPVSILQTIDQRHIVRSHQVTNSSFYSNLSVAESAVKETKDMLLKEKIQASQINKEAKMPNITAGQKGNESSSVQASRKDMARCEANPPKKWYLVVSLYGRLGNVLFIYASAYCIARMNNLTLIVMGQGELRDLPFQNFVAPKAGWSPKSLSPLQHHPATMGCAFNPSLMTLKPTCSHHILDYGYLQSWKYFEPCRTEVKRVLLFKDHIIKTAENIVQNLRQKMPHSTLVGVHERREDYLLPNAKNAGLKVAPRDYYLRAMTYFRSRFHNVTFVMITANRIWFRREVTNATDVLVLQRTSSPAVDMEVLSRMDHIIFTVGTFGWWAAYKNSGTVVGYKDFYVPDSVYGRKMKNSSANYFYPGWVAL